MSDLVGNHIVGFSMMWLVCCGMISNRTKRATGAFFFIVAPSNIGLWVLIRIAFLILN